MIQSHTDKHMHNNMHKHMYCIVLYCIVLYCTSSKDIFIQNINIFPLFISSSFKSSWPGCAMNNNNTFYERDTNVIICNEVQGFIALLDLCCIFALSDNNNIKRYIDVGFFDYCYFISPRYLIFFAFDYIRSLNHLIVKGSSSPCHPFLILYAT